MRWDLSAEQADFRDVLRGWLADRCDSTRLREWYAADELAGIEFEQEFAAEGWAAVGTAEELGGQGGGLVELALVAEELGRAGAPGSAWLGSVLAFPALVSTPEAVKALLADGVVTVPAIPAAQIPQAQAVTFDGALVRGEVPFVLAGDRARRFVVPARAADGERLVVLVDRGTEGITIRPRRLLDRSRAVADLVLAGVPATVLETDAAAVLEQAALRAAVLVAADALGSAQRMLDLAVSYAGQRRQFGVPIGSFQAVKHAAATMLVTVEAARSIVYPAAAMVDAGDPAAGMHAAVAKAQVTGGAAALADSALTLHGAIGYTWEHDLQLFYKRAKLDERLFGAPAAWNERIADALDLVAS